MHPTRPHSLLRTLCRRGRPLGLGLLLCGLGTASLLTSCQDRLFFTEYRRLPQAQWHRADTLLFTLPVSDRDRDVHLTLALRHSAHISYRRLVARAQLLADPAPSADSSAHSAASSRPAPTATVVASSTLTVPIYDDRGVSLGHGFPLIDCTSSPVDLHLQAHRCYTLRLVHQMRLTPLDELPEVGVFLEDVPPRASSLLQRLLPAAGHD